MINDKCPMINDNSSGLTLLEIVAVVAIMALSAALMAPVLKNKADQTRLVRTIESMEEIKKAIVGITSDRVRGAVRFAGYVQDMGGLPELTEGQPKGLWTNDPKGAPDDETDDLIPSKLYWYKRLDFIRVGWRGPYVKPPSGGVLVDGWGTPFVFQNIKNDLVITSLGADGKEGGTDLDKDVSHRIRKLDWMGSISGYVSSQSVFLEDSGTDPIAVRIYLRPATADCQKIDAGERGGEGYPLKDCVDYLETAAKADGYFCFTHVPIGTQRLLLVAQQTAGSHGYKIAVEPGAMWMGTLGVAH
jgi:type II secretory pathway pseudopilin PulG